MNRPIARLFVITGLLFAVLVAFTSRWTVFDSEELRDNALNQRPRLEQTFVRRGTIRAEDGTVLARSLRRADETYTRTYPTDDLFGHAIGYAFTRYGLTGTERDRNDELTGANDPIGTLLDDFRGRAQEGDNLITHLDPTAQRVALQGLAGRKGAVVALDPSTGAVKVMASTPGFDPNAVAQPGELARLNSDNANAPLLNRTTQAGYPPGSTMKVVTAIAAIDSGRFEPTSVVSGKNGKEISGVPLNNFGGEDFGDVNLTFALTNSINTVWATVGEQLGGATMQRYMDRLGFGADPPIDYPADQLRPSGEFLDGRPIPATDDAVDVGRMAIGQDKLAVTPLQMAMVASAVANGGTLMKPRIADRFVDSDGRTTKRVEPEEQSEVMSASSAREVGQMMTKVVEEGSGTAAALSGISVAGKTGTAEVDRRCGPNQVWFIGFAPASNPKVAVAVTLECSAATGGTVAAPIARQVMQSLLR